MQVKLSLPDELVVELDRMRGDVTRSRFVQRLVESVGGEPTILSHVRTPTPVVERSPVPQLNSEPSRGSLQPPGYDPAAEREVHAQMVRELAAPRRHSPTCSCAVCKPPKS